jgi:osmosensitive K+ channel His kinase sensor protein
MAKTEKELDRRPDPDAPLALADREGRGKLSLFLGAAPGVGKTYAMLAKTRALKTDGVRCDRPHRDTWAARNGSLDGGSRNCRGYGALTGIVAAPAESVDAKCAISNPTTWKPRVVSLEWCGVMPASSSLMRRREHCDAERRR